MKFGKPVRDLLLFFFQAVITRQGLFLFLPCGSYVHTGRILPDKFLLQFFFCQVQLCPQLSPVFPDRFRFLQKGVHLLQCLPDLLLKLLDLPAASQEVAAVFERASADGSARCEQLAFQGDHAQAVACFSGKADRIVHMVYYQDPAQKGCGHIPVLFLCRHQAVRQADDAGLRKELSLPEFLAVLHAGQGQEGGPSPLYRLQEGDHFLRGILAVRHNVLDAAAQRRFDRNLIFFIHLQKIRNHAQDTGMLLPLLHDTLHASAVSFVAFRQIDQGVQPGLFLMIGHLHIAHLLVLPCELIAHSIQPLFLGADGRVQGADPLIDPVEFLFQLVDAGILLFLLRPGAQQPGIQLRPTDLDLLQHGIKTLHAGLNNGALIQLFDDPAAPSVDQGGCFLRLRLNGGKKLRSLRPLFLHPGKALVRLGLACGQLFLFPCPLFDLLFQRLFPVLQMEAVGTGGIDLLLQDVDLALQAASEHGGVRKLCPGLLDAFVQRVDLPLDALIFFPDPVILPRGLRKFFGSVFIPAVQLGKLPGKPAVFQQEGIHVKPLLLLFFLQIYPGLLRLLLQRAGLLFQFGKNIPDA